MQSRNNTLLLFLYLSALAIAALLTRNLIPVDETRYTAVAWEMWLRGDFLVPYLNGETYSHKPPLLFWLMQLGWTIFGVNEWWPRLIPYFFSFASLLLIQNLGRKLWPDTDAYLMAPFIALGFTIWAFFSTAVMFDMMLTFFVLLAMSALYQAFNKPGYRAWLLLGLAWGLGMLSKGPVIFVHTLPLLLLARFWLPSTLNLSAKQVVTGFVLALIVAIAIILAWVIPATLSGGEEYAESLLFGQNVQRALKAPNDALPWWYYVAFMPLILFPWLYWSGSWKALLSKKDREGASDDGRKFCIAWALPVLILFTLISGKKVHYLLPVLPAVSLFLASLLASRKQQGRDSEMWPLTVIYLGVAVIIGSLPWLYSAEDSPYWVFDISIYSALPFVVLAIAGQLLVKGNVVNRVRMISLQTVFLLMIAHAAIFIPASMGYDLRPIAEEIAELQNRGETIAHNGKYRGEFHFLGRLTKPFVVIHNHTEKEWMAEHPDAYVIDYRYDLCGEQQEPVEYQRLYRNGQCLTIRTVAQQIEYKGY